ncbi:MAG: LPS export ABC transporter periplasmic protein LptC [Betaproteobacteria bacterium]|jgi:lipopolysaccharide export system protein LptC|nr:LPS export ABC transporter periplasmic protein LptC [Rhodocyclaceae bacterium]MCA3135136.1 LPS export ABC transporter periplasmic protein LptC [Rhodocyclaceae bacterium]MCA3143526.1 LPS export ABC transporter periplasmic protein LptC [Rhodocyclaceae bacterium]MCA3145416.1 LPS export ABC transporter periplasmic protein LptC [Rhodocyclaceae bacterium]MCE2896944.1 LPS export ABC transporter periplasmic protein LptC [Betaproteobacteria bacterium]
MNSSLADRLVRWYPVLLLALLAGLTGWLDQRVRPPTPPRDGTSRHDPDMIMENFAAVKLYPDGTRRHALNGRRMVHHPDDDSTQVEEPEFFHYAPPAAPVHATARRALLSRNGESVFFTGAVRISRAAYADAPPLHLATEFLHLIPDQDLARTDKPVTLTRGTLRADGVGMEFNNRARTLKMLSNVKVHYDGPIAAPLDPRR